MPFGDVSQLRPMFKAKNVSVGASKNVPLCRYFMAARVKRPDNEKPLEES
ncbi:protein of unknown function [Thermococcus camini]|uniref:Uncharacterized protein n=1 Tax=Thermococcus camini TaxID=2016373 RepID=A0A7G2D9W2_9EURY|nr:protein of unknown function [Thermococcus camini]